MQHLSEIISRIWREGNMPPSVKRQQTPEPNTLQRMGDILDSGIAATEMAKSKVTAALYGRNGAGKTTFACQGQGPIALISIDPAPTGGSRSVSNRSDITVYQAAARYLIGKDGKPEMVKGSEKVLAIAEGLKRRFAVGQQPFKKVVIDGVTSWNDVILSEVLGLNYEEMPAILGWGKVSMDQYTERGERLMRYLKPFLDLPCDLWIIAQERDHNPPKEADNKGRMRVMQSKLMRDAHPLAQEGSFFSLGVGDTPAKFIQDSCDFVMQLYEDNEYREERTPDIKMADGSVIAGVTQQIPTGRLAKRLRCVYHANYAARFRAPDYRNVPEYIEAPTPEERYQAFLDVVIGKRTKWGKYVNQV